MLIIVVAAFFGYSVLTNVAVDKRNYFLLTLEISHLLIRITDFRIVSRPAF